MKLTEADTIAEATLQHARSIGAAPMTVVVLDAGGQTFSTSPVEAERVIASNARTLERISSRVTG